MTKKIQILINQFKSYLSIQKQRSHHTTKNYISDISQFFSMTRLTNITLLDKKHIDLYIQNLNKLNLSSKTINRKLCALEHFFNYLVSNDYISFNPCKLIRRPKQNITLPHYLEETSILELLNNYPTETNEHIRNKAILELLFSSGIRVSECVNLNITDLNLNNLECKIIGKGDKERISLFGKRCKNAINYYLDFVYGNWSTNGDALFISKNGSRVTQRTIQRIVKESNKYHSSNIEITPHICRHSCASMLLTNGANIRDIQDLLGHSSIITTQRYANIPTKKLKERFLNIM